MKWAAESRRSDRARGPRRQFDQVRHEQGIKGRQRRRPDVGVWVALDRLGQRLLNGDFVLPPERRQAPRRSTRGAEATGTGAGPRPAALRRADRPRGSPARSSQPLMRRFDALGDDHSTRRTAGTVSASPSAPLALMTGPAPDRPQRLSVQTPGTAAAGGPPGDSTRTRSAIAVGPPGRPRLTLSRPCRPPRRGPARGLSPPAAAAGPLPMVVSRHDESGQPGGRCWLSGAAQAGRRRFGGRVDALLLPIAHLSSRVRCVRQTRRTTAPTVAETRRMRRSPIPPAARLSTRSRPFGMWPTPRGAPTVRRGVRSVSKNAVRERPVPGRGKSQRSRHSLAGGRGDGPGRGLKAPGVSRIEARG